MYLEELLQYIRLVLTQGHGNRIFMCHVAADRGSFAVAKLRQLLVNDGISLSGAGFSVHDVPEWLEKHVNDRGGVAGMSPARAENFRRLVWLNLKLEHLQSGLIPNTLKA